MNKHLIDPRSLRNIFPERFLFIILILITASACPEPPCEKTELPDLVGDIDAGSAEIPAGENFPMDHQIENLEAQYGCTSTAGNSDTSLNIEYSEDPDSTYSSVGFQTNPVPPIDPGKGFTEKYEILFANPGIYRITTFADGTFKVPERIEDNNDDMIGALGRSGKGLNIQIKVTPTRDIENLRRLFPNGEKVIIRRVSIEPF